MLLIVAAALAAEPPCPFPRSAADLRVVLDRAEAAWTGEPAAFEDAVGAVGPVLSCVVEPIPAADAARLHRIRGLAAFSRRDMVEATADFAAAAAIEPTFTFPEDVVPAGHPIDTLYKSARVDPHPAPILAPRDGWVIALDGTPSSVRTPELPALVQLTDPVGRIQTRLVAAEASMPRYPTRRSQAGVPLIVAGAVAVAASAGVWTYGVVTKPEDLATVEEGTAAMTRQTILGAVAIGLGVLGATGLSVGVVVARW